MLILRFLSFKPNVIQLQMGNACGVLDVQLLAAKVRSEDSKLKNQLSRLEPELKKLLEGHEQRLSQASATLWFWVTMVTMVTMAPPPLESMPEGEETEAMGGGMRWHKAMHGTDMGQVKEGSFTSLGFVENWLKEARLHRHKSSVSCLVPQVPTELLLYTLKSRAGSEMIS
eukprot:Skav202623  [mRNA]  locus=scaffold515:95364:99412:- [translate_table: standard]